MDFSIIIPVLNEEKNLPKCFKYINALDYPKDKYEVIVVDNGSTDASVKIVKEHGFEVIKEPRRGITFARQTGLEHSKGDIYITTDADARVSKDWLKNAKTVFGKDKNIVAITGPSFFYDTSIYHSLVIALGSWILLKTLIRPSVMGCNMALKRKEALKCGGFTKDNYGFYEDSIISARISKHGKIVCDWRFKNYISVRRYKGIKVFRVFRNILNHFFLRWFDTMFSDRFRVMGE